MQLTLDGVCHSVNEPGTPEPSLRWYGSEEKVDLWLENADEILLGLEKRSKQTL